MKTDLQFTITGARDKSPGLWLILLNQIIYNIEVVDSNSSYNRKHNVRSNNSIISARKYYPSSSIVTSEIETENAKNI